ncbi:MAG: hypothetical protein H0W70_07685, partial [Actinobacteria bacterium]|nr:hypothetical protein [Actinomycetota bacterium]
TGAGAGAGAIGGSGSAAVDPSLAGYSFSGLSWQLVLFLLIASVLVARWLRRFLQARLLS